MNDTLFIIISLIVVGALWLLLKITEKKTTHPSLSSISGKKNNPFDNPNSTLPYIRRTLMTHTELQVYATLLKALPNYMIFTQVQVSRVLTTERNEDNYYWFNFISRLSYDFVICRLHDSTPIAVIELDDKSHHRKDRQKVDQRKDRATQSAGLTMIRWKVGQVPSQQDISQLIRKLDKQNK